MSDILSKKVTLFNNVSCTKFKDVELRAVLMGETFKSKVDALRNESDPDKQKSMKIKLPCYKIAGTFKGGADADLKQPSGLLGVDIDAKDNPMVTNFDKLKDVIGALPFVAYCGLSCRGKGYFCIVPIKEPSQYKQHYESLKRDFAQFGLVIDASCSNVGHLRFVSYDPEPYINPDAEVYAYVVPSAVTPSYKKDRASRTDEERATIDYRTLRIVSEVCHTQTDITADYEVWWCLACALASEYSDAGRAMFHALSKWSQKYDEGYTDETYDNALGYKEHTASIATLFYYASLHGIAFHDEASTDFKDVALQEIENFKAMKK